MKDQSLKEMEYETLREEILQCQSRRFSVVTGSLVIVFAILGWVVSAPDKLSWTLVSSLILFLLTIAGCMTWLIGRSNSGISTYLEVFHEKGSTEIGWERRHRKFKRKLAGSKGAYIAMYLGVGILSVVMAKEVCAAAPSLQSIRMFYFSTGTFLLMLVTLTFWSRPWKRYISKWEKIRDEENRKLSEGKNIDPAMTTTTTAQLSPVKDDADSSLLPQTPDRVTIAANKLSSN
jgi:hypothetical protein